MTTTIILLIACTVLAIVDTIALVKATQIIIKRISVRRAHKAHEWKANQLDSLLHYAKVNYFYEPKNF